MENRSGKTKARSTMQTNTRLPIFLCHGSQGANPSRDKTIPSFIVQISGD
jgi:hypothetical protein